MNPSKASLLLLPAILLALSLARAEEKKRVSPHETVKATVDGNEISVVYGRPYSKDPKSGEKRTIWGGLVPYDKVWRMGADEATLFTTSKAIEMGGKEISAGTYSLYMWPEEKGAKLIVNKQTGQWGTKYDESQDVARVEMKKESAAKPADQFTIAIEEAKSGGGEFKASWEGNEYVVPFTVKK